MPIRLTRLPGGISYVVVFDRITAQKDFGWAVRSMGFIALGLSLVSFPALVSGTGSSPGARTRRSLARQDSPSRICRFISFSVGALMTFLGYMVPYFYISTFAQETLGISSSLSLYCLVIATAGSFFGRLSAGVVSPLPRPDSTWLCCAAVSGILCLCWMAVRDQNGLIAFSVFWGFGSAGLVTLPAAVFPSLCPRPTATWHQNRHVGAVVVRVLVGTP